MPWPILFGAVRSDMIGSWLRFGILTALAIAGVLCANAMRSELRLGFMAITAAIATLVAAGWIHAIQRWRRERGAWLAALPLTESRWRRLEQVLPILSVLLVIMPQVWYMQADALPRLPIVTLAVACGILAHLQLVSRYHQGTALSLMMWVIGLTFVLRVSR